MSRLIIDDLDGELRNRLEALARIHGHSVVEEVRNILRGAVDAGAIHDPNEDLGTSLARRFAGLGLDQPIPELRFGEIKPPDFGS